MILFHDASKYIRLLFTADAQELRVDVADDDAAGRPGSACGAKARPSKVCSHVRLILAHLTAIPHHFTPETQHPRACKPFFRWSALNLRRSDDHQISPSGDEVGNPEFESECCKLSVIQSDQSKPSSTTEQSQPPAIAAYPTGHYAGSPYPPPTGPYPFYYPPHPEANGGDPNAPNGLPPTAYMMPFPHPGLVYAYPPPPPPPAGYAFPPPTAPAATAKPKRKQVKMACTNCAAACKRCDEARPCERCQKYGIAESCVDGVRKERKKGIKRGPYKRKNKSASTETAPYNGYPPSGEGQWPPPGEHANGGVPNGHPTMPPQFIPAPEGYYPYYYPPPPGYAQPPPHEHGDGSPNGQPPPPHHPYYPLHPAYPPIPVYPPGSYVPMPGQAPPGQAQSGEGAEGKHGLPGGAGAEAGAGEAKKKKRGRASEDGGKAKKAKRPAVHAGTSTDADGGDCSSDDSPVMSSAPLNGNGTGPHPPVIAAA